MKTIIVNQISARSFLKMVLLGSMTFLVPFSSLMGVFAFFGAGTVQWNGRPLTGFVGFAASPFIGAFLSLMFTVLAGSASYLGLWIFLKFSRITIRIDGVQSDGGQ